MRALTRRLEVPLVASTPTTPDLAVLVGADFVHVGQDDLPIEAVRRLDLRVGQSTHAPAELDATVADYAGVGPVYETPTKVGRPAAGLDYVRYAAGHARLPWFAIGGIDEANVADVVAAGAERIAVVRAITVAGTRARSRLAARSLAELIATMGRPLAVPGSSIGRASGC